VYPCQVEPQLGFGAVPYATRGVKGNDHLGSHLLAVELPLEIGQLAGDVLGGLVGDEGVLLAAQPLGDIDVDLEGQAAVALVFIDQTGVLEVLRTDAGDEELAVAQFAGHLWPQREGQER